MWYRPWTMEAMQLYCPNLPSSRKLPQKCTSYNALGICCSLQMEDTFSLGSFNQWLSTVGVLRSHPYCPMQESSHSNLCSEALHWTGQDVLVTALLSEALGMHSSFPKRFSQKWRLSFFSYSYTFCSLSFLCSSFTSNKFLVLLIPSWHLLPRQRKLTQMVIWFITKILQYSRKMTTC